MGRGQAYRRKERRDLAQLITDRKLQDPMQSRYLQSRWLDQLAWMDDRASHSKNWHYFLRLTSLLGGLATPTLVALHRNGLRYPILASSLVVAACIALDEFFRFGETWRHYRITAESLKVEGWEFLTQSARYAGKGDQAFSQFSSKIEAMIQRDVQQYFRHAIPPADEGEVQRQRPNGSGGAAAEVPT